MSLVEQGISTPVQPVAATTAEQQPADKQLIGFWKRYNRPVLYLLGGILLATGGYAAYQNLVVAPNEMKAQESMFRAEQYFARDSFRLALKGDGVNKGFEYLANEYSGTKSGELAHYYAGICELQTGNFQKAADHLNDFDTESDQIQMMAYGALGDAYSELKKTDDAIEAYKKAATTFEKDETNSSEYLFRAALLSEIAGKNDQAISLYKELKKKYSRTEKGFNADKYLYRLSAEKNEFSVK